MTPCTPESRRQRATMLVTQIAEIVYKEGRRYPAFFYLTLLETRDILADPEENDAETALTDAAQRFKRLYHAPRDNFSEFYVYSGDPEQRAADNQRLEELVSELRSMFNNS